MEPDPVGLADLLTRARAQEPHKTALSEAATGRRITWQELDELVWRVAGGLYEAGLVAGVRVALASTNRIEAVAAYLGVLRAGMVAVPVDPSVATGELVRVLVDSGARLVVCDEAAVTTVRAAVRGLGQALADAGREEGSRPRVVTVGGTVEAEPGERDWDRLVVGAGRPTPLRADPDSLAALLYTSGASGRPRAAMLTHRALLSGIEQVADGAPLLHGNDVVLGAVPLHHSYGLCLVLGQVLRHHARLVLVDHFEAEGSLDIVEDEAVTIAPLTPTALQSWLEVPSLEERTGPLRTVFSGSAALAPDVAAAVATRTGVPVHQGYGLTECGAAVTSTLVIPRREEPAVPGSAGRALRGVSLRLRDEQGREPVDGDPGVIEVRDPQLFSGYWPDGRGGPDAEGWWATGDVGLLDGDGELHLVDRVRDVVVVSGFPVFPVEVEEVVAELPAVGAVAVVGIEDESAGEAVVAFVCPAEGVDPLDAADLEGVVRRHCETRLARFKVPAVVHVVDDLPRTGTGKVQKGRLRARASGRDAGVLR